MSVRARRPRRLFSRIFGTTPLIRSLTALVVLAGTLFLGTSWAAAASNSTTPIGGGPLGPWAPLECYSKQTCSVVQLFIIIVIESAIVFALVLGVLIINILRFSHKPGDDEEPEQIFGNRRVEVAWTVIPAAILAVMFVLTVLDMSFIDVPARAQGSPKIGLPAGTPLKITVTGHQWWWQFNYPQFHVQTANEIYLPKGIEVIFDITSVDVLHSFWIPQLTRQIQATPNIQAYVNSTPSSTGIFPGACYEFCGQGHAWMQFRSIVVTPKNFNSWIRNESKPPAAPTSALAKEGRNLFLHYTCGQCHTLTGTGADKTAGPDLSHFGSRWGIAGGVLPNSLKNTERWILDPDKWKDGALMPSFPLSRHDIRALATFIYGNK
jgi:cytochrome c oxidase subunit 2